jgi:hypothetical protein
MEIVKFLKITKNNRYYSCPRILIKSNFYMQIMVTAKYINKICPSDTDELIVRVIAKKEFDCRWETW